MTGIDDTIERRIRFVKLWTVRDLVEIEVEPLSL